MFHREEDDDEEETKKMKYRVTAQVQTVNKGLKRFFLFILFRQIYASVISNIQ